MLLRNPASTPSTSGSRSFQQSIKAISSPLNKVPSHTRAKHPSTHSGSRAVVFVLPEHHSSAELGMDVAELSVTAELIERTESKEAQLLEGAAAETLSKEPWVQQLIASHKDSKLVFTADGNSAEARQHLSTGLSQDHLFLSLLQNNMIQDMVVLYAAERKIITVLRLGVPVCGHPTIVHGGLISAIFDETFGVLLYAAGRWGHFDLSMVFTARLEVDYKKPLPAESTIVCEAEVESVEGARSGSLHASQTRGDIVYACSRALFVKPKQPPSIPAAASEAVAVGTTAAAAAAAQN